jgi:tRNA threonylcarbamoyladenosine biosynthesis protein TsaB
VRTIFGFDTATTTTSCALVRDGEVVGERLTEARSVLAAADELIRAARIAPGDLDGLVVGTGPGSFTSIRIGLATARGLGLSLGVPAAGISSLLAYDGGVPVIDARRGEVFSGGPGRIVLGRPEDLEVAGRRLVGDGAVRYRRLLTEAGAVIPPDDDAAHLPSAALLVARAGAFGPADEIEPLYVRVPDAVPSP